MAVHLSLQIGNLVNNLRQRGTVAFGQFLNPLGELLTDAIHLTVDVGIESSEPFVVDHQGLDLGVAEFGIVSIGLGVKRCLGDLEALLELGLFVGELQQG